MNSADQTPESNFDEDTKTGAEENREETAQQQHVDAVADAQLTTKRVSAPSAPSGDQLATTRAAHWHQDDNALLTMEALRTWLQRSGLVLYGPRPQLGAPAPSWIEATLGKAEAAPEIGSTDTARSLLARLVAEGAVVPLNLLGATGGIGTDAPDFVASAAVFSYIFTLRGNKAWKQAPVTAGPVKVSPLALAVYEMLSAKVTLSAYDLATQLGKEVTEGAVLRALTELWSQLRVIPVPQQDGSATLWELASARFTKQIKAGANAGQPSALSALISLYLGQAMAATEDEIESFLSPLAPRSRVRDVIHALLAGRQLETLVVKGKTLLHVAGDLPVFAAARVEDTIAAPVIEAEPGSRISKLAAKPGSKIGTGLRSKPAFGKKPFGAKPSFGAKPPYGKPAGDRERRPFKRDERAGSAPPRAARPRFDKPWEEKAPRFEPPAEGLNVEASAPSESRPPRREFPPREGAGPRKTFSKPGTFGRKREGFGAKPGFGRSSNRGEGRPPRQDFADRGTRAERPAAGGFKRPGSYSPRPSGERGGKPSFAPKRDFGGKPSFGAKPSFGRSRPDSGDAGEAPRKVFRKFDAPRSPKPFGAKPTGGKFFGGKTADRPERPSRTFDAGAERPKRSFDSKRETSRPSFGDRKPGGFAGKPGKPFGDRKPGGFGPKKPFGSKPGGFKSGAKPSGPFAKFADGKKPFRKPGPGRKTERPTGKTGDGGYRPTKRKRPEGDSAE